MNKRNKSIIGILSGTMLFSSVLGTVTFAEEESNASFDTVYQWNTSIESIEIEANDVEFINKSIEEQQDNDLLNTNDNILMMRAVAVQPGIGSLITTINVVGVGAVHIYTSGVVIAGVVAKAGSVLYNSVKDYVVPYVIGATIPNSLKKDGNTVDLGSFKDKHGNTPLNKNSGTFNNGKWNVSKDTANHGGRKWKLKKDDKRKASLDEKGNIIAD
ncbi:hypothetical protein ACQKM9_15730 [Viridibacillus sp. NPDC093762]|uniref:hypothetical protein n=1 Tax=Viridibacillus sp. NPDC093762 TaxID=3390720 RepID=UPI003CFF9C1D